MRNLKRHVFPLTTDQPEYKPKTLGRGIRKHGNYQLCLECPNLHTCKERVKHGVWVCCEIPDELDMMRLMGLEDMPTKKRNSEVQMNEMQLFEVGLSDTYGGAYWYKYNVGTYGITEAMKKAKEFAVEEASRQEADTFETEEEHKDYIKEVRLLKVTRVHSLGIIVI